MNERDLRALKKLLDESRSDLKRLEGMAKSLVARESQILEIVRDHVSYPRQFEREIQDLRRLARTCEDHAFLRRVARMVPDLDREVRAERHLSEDVREDLENALVQVGDTQMTLGSLLRALEKKVE